MKISESDFRARVHVYPRLEILDPQGKAISEALARLGFEDVLDVRAGKAFEVGVRADNEVAARVRVEEMCTKLLANSVTEDFRVEIVPTKAPPGAAGS